LNPIYSEKDKVFLPQLTGSWAEKDSEGSWNFIADERGGYRLELKDEDGEASVFVAQLARVEGALLLDLFPDRPAVGLDADITEMHLIGLHSFAVVHQLKPTLKMSFMEQEWLEEHLQSHPGALDFVQRDNRLILTSSTLELQQFVIRHLQTEDAFFESEELHRIAASD
jgi:hypothetical protein